MDKTIITNNQLLSLVANATIGGSVLVITSLITSIAKQDAWITVLVTIVFGMPVIWVYWFLGSQYPNMTFIEILKKIFGKWIGLIVAGSFVYLCLTVSYQLPWYIGNFMNAQAMPETPAYVINTVFIIGMIIGVFYGIETIARASELFLYIASIFTILAMLLVSPNASFENLQPFFEKGIIPNLKGSVFMLGINTFPLIPLMMIYPNNTKNISEAKKSLFKGYLWAGLMMFIVTFMSILVMGSGITSITKFPMYLLAKEINIGNIFSRLEFLISASWIITLFMLSILFFYAGVIGFSQLFGLKEHKRIVVPLGLILTVMSGVVFPTAQYEVKWVSFAWTPYITTFGLIIPMLLVLVFWIKKWVVKVGDNK